MTGHAGFLLVLQPLPILNVTLYVGVRGRVAVDGKEVPRFVDLKSKSQSEYLFNVS